MANSRKSTHRNKPVSLEAAFKRALDDILARVFISSHSGPRRIGVAYSGGLDSSMLLRLCGEYAYQKHLSLYAFHVHHGLSSHADAWAEHCRKTAEQQGAACHTAMVSVDERDPRGVEEAARIARYAALKLLCRQHQIPLLLTGHHQDDQAETVLLQLARGAGLGGLAGMASLQQDHPLLGGDLFLGRPLLRLSRRQLAEAAAMMGLPYVDDESNADRRYRRNAVRLQLLPCMEATFPDCAPAIARSAEHVQSAAALLDDLAALDLLSCQGGDGHRLQIREMGKLSERRMINLLRYWIRQQSGSPLSVAQLAELCEQMFHAADDAKPVLDAGTMRFWRFKGCLFARRKPGAIEAAPTVLRWCGEEVMHIPTWNGRLHFRRDGRFGLAASELKNSDIELAPRSGGERIKVAPNRPTKVLKALYQENGIPPWQRERLPLVYLNRTLVFAAGIGMDIRHAAAEDGIVLQWDGDCSDLTVG